MKKTILFAAMFSAFSIATYAQDATPAQKDKPQQGERRQGGGQRFDIYEGLDLSKEQKDKLKVVDDEQRSKMQALRDDNSLADDARREKMMEIRKATTEKRNTILTKEQKEKLEAKMKERGNRGPGQGGGGQRN